MSDARAGGARVVRADLTDTSLDPADLLEAVADPAHGASLLFVGTVRDHADGRPVSGMRYEAYVAMAEHVLHEIAEEAASCLGRGAIAVTHRIGTLAIGETSVAIAVASPHRAPAWEAGRYVIEEIKRRLPVWKHEDYADGEASWVEGHPLEAEGEASARVGSDARPDARVGPDAPTGPTAAEGA
ncbi:MAG: molybdenum cofactor biosynthesis protein MoaE [Longimicrobiales bacterium]|nr:molybdenum cofactor biosynthesis protein MoaE [Longimicrobiales bacterium]